MCEIRKKLDLYLEGNCTAVIIRADRAQQVSNAQLIYPIQYYYIRCFAHRITYTYTAYDSGICLLYNITPLKHTVWRSWKTVVSQNVALKTL